MSFDFSLLFGLMIIPFSFLFFPKIYFNKRLVLPLFILCFIIAGIGLTIKTQTDPSKPDFNLFLLCPLFSIMVLRLQLYIFRKALRRNPKNPPRNIVFIDEDGLGWDRLFYFAFMMLSLGVPLFLLAYFYG